jgi:hypothetical protein
LLGGGVCEGFWAAKSLHAVAELGIADVIHQHVPSTSFCFASCGWSSSGGVTLQDVA